MKEIQVYLERNNNRIEYVFNHMFYELFGVRPKFILDINKVENSSPVIEYGQKKNLTSSIFLFANDAIYQKNFVDKDPEYIKVEGKIAFFPTNSPDAILPFDLVSLIFFFLSRVEETYKPNRDHFNRFSAEYSILYTHDALLFPIVDFWIDKFMEDHVRIANNRQYRFFPTFDIDHAWKYKHRSFILNLGSIAKSLFRLEINDLIHRIKVLVGLQKDPFDTLDEILESLKKNDIQSVFFFLTGGNTKYDRGTSIRDETFRKLIHSIAQNHKVGIHPSFRSNEMPALFTSEKQSLEEALNRKIEMSRQHYLKLNLPFTYNELIKIGIREEFSLGYHDAIGFRAGTGQCFKWYDLHSESATDLLVHPLVLMDVTLKNYMNLQPETALNEFLKVRDLCKNQKLTFHILLHNTSFSEYREWKGWSHIFRSMITQGI